VRSFVDQLAERLAVQGVKAEVLADKSLRFETPISITWNSYRRWGLAITFANGVTVSGRSLIFPALTDEQRKALRRLRRRKCKFLARRNKPAKGPEPISPS
jgi:hypothetical protein